MTDETPQINNEAAFLAAMGVNPNVVRAGTVGIEFQNGQPIVHFVLMVPTDWKQLGEAIAAGADGKMPTPPKAPADRKPAQKRTQTRKKS